MPVPFPRSATRGRAAPPPHKVDAVASLAAMMRSSEAVLSLDLRGMTAPVLTGLRRALGKHHGHLLIVKNTLINRATALPYTPPVVPSPAAGPTALVFAFADPVPVMRAVLAFAREHKTVCAFKGARVENWHGEGDALDWFVSLGTYRDQLAIALAQACALPAATARAVDGLIILRSEDPTARHLVEEDIMPVDVDALIHSFKHLTLIELAEFNERFRTTFGVVDAPVVAVAATTNEVVEAEEQDEFEVVLEQAGVSKILVIKVVREVVRGLGLKEAKELVEAAPKSIAEGVTRAEAEALREKLVAVGATAIVR